MGLLSFIVTLPVAPVRGIISLGELIQRQVEEELNDPANARRALEELEEAQELGELDEEEVEEAEEAILDQLTAPHAPAKPEEG
ncbi:hypothetical protein GONAM_28_00240 [Gordonia namibiensis NBRC 108229]|uniref:Gas vesicle protein G n=1 Tax=Gordonia namibiensis NBRC 108229 TaxID=1208314 RepID=K6X605_9ACTN|nr:gas vesicle protein GvpG [Gordonia namibiensis]GAC01522.1 hypothetical protein GONAM_28_00240 [Gordonia namibiensis NBRC 108229]